MRTMVPIPMAIASRQANGSLQERTPPVQTRTTSRQGRSAAAARYSSLATRSANQFGPDHPFDTAAGTLRTWVRLQQPPETGPVTGHQKVREFVDEDVVDDILGHALQAMRKTDTASAGVQDPQRVF